MERRAQARPAEEGSGPRPVRASSTKAPVWLSCCSSLLPSRLSGLRATRSERPSPAAPRGLPRDSLWRVPGKSPRNLLWNNKQS